MGIAPPSDIVLDVVRNADPAKMRDAVEKLKALKPALDSVNKAGFEEQLARLRGVAKDNAASVAPSVTNNKPPVVSGLQEQTGVRVKHEPDTRTKFDAFVFQTFVEAMLPKESEALFGGGSAGDFWRSMLAEKIAEQLATSTKLSLLPELKTEGKPSENSNLAATAASSAETTKPWSETSVTGGSAAAQILDVLDGLQTAITRARST